MKKLLAILLSAAMVFTSGVVAQAADTIDIECQLSNDSVQVGDTFYADFKVTDNPMGYNTMTAYFRYDPDVIRAVECEVSDIPDDLIIYQTESAGAASLFSYSFVNGRLNFVPKLGDRDYEGNADGKKTASEIGIIKLTGYLGSSADGYLQNYEGTGTLLRMKFEAVGNGTSDIMLDGLTAAYFEKGIAHDLDVNLYNGQVSVSGGSSSVDEPDSETTTSSTNNSGSFGNSGSSGSGGSSGGGGSSSSTTTTETTTVSEETEATTSSITENNMVSQISFADVKSTDWFYEPVMKLAAAKVVNGYSADNTFRPGNNVTRADFLLMLLRGMGIDTDNAPDSNFDDVSESKYYYNAVGIAKEMGIASGDGKNFNPENNITRQDMMILAKKALEIGLDTEISGDVSVLDQFNDKDDISSYAVDSLAAMVSEGIVSGMGDGIAPKANTTRAQAVVIISKIMDKMM